MDKNPTTRSYPRTVQEAFGPYTSYEVYTPPRRRLPLRTVAIIVAELIALAVVYAVTLGGWK